MCFRCSQVDPIWQNDEVPDSHVPGAGHHKEHGLGDVGGLKQGAALERFPAFGFGPVIQQGGADGAGEDGADADAVGEELAAEAVDEALDGELGGGVDRLMDHGDDAGHRAGEQDIAGLLGDKVGEDGVDTAEGGVDVEVEDVLHGGGVGVDEGPAGVEAGVGMEDIEPAGEAEDMVGEAVGLSGVSDIGEQGQGVLAEVGGTSAEGGDITVNHDDAGASGEEGTGAGEADAGGGAGDGGDLTVEG